MLTANLVLAAYISGSRISHRWRVPRGSQGRARLLVVLRAKCAAAFPPSSLHLPPINPWINPPSTFCWCKNFVAPGHAPLLHIHYSTQSPKNSRCEFSTMHRNRVATGTRQQDLSPLCSPSSAASSATACRPLRSWPSPSASLLVLRVNGATSVVAFSLTTPGGSPLLRSFFRHIARNVAFRCLKYDEIAELEVVGVDTILINSGYHKKDQARRISSLKRIPW